MHRPIDSSTPAALAPTSPRRARTAPAARRAAVVAFALGCAGCLVIDDPDFSPAERTPPEILPITPTTELIRAPKLDNAYQVPSFFYNVRGEDAGDEVHTVLLIDYGLPGTEGPYRDAVGASLILPGKAGDIRGPFSSTWTALSPPNGPWQAGCHTVTLLATHEFRGKTPGPECPKDANDVDTVTWVVSLCSGGLETCTFDDCPTSGTADLSYCDSVIEDEP